MIIKRYYATYGQLSEDEASRKAIISVFDKYSIPQDVCEYLLDPYNGVLFAHTDEGCCIPGSAYNEMRQAFEALDVTEPFDNGFTYRDVSKVMSFPSRKGAATMQILISEKSEQPRMIVQVIAFEYKNGQTNFIEPWDIREIMI